MKLKHIISSIVIVFLAFPLSQAFAQVSVTIQVLTTYDYPGASQTRPQKINDNGNIVGVYLDSAGASHGFVRAKNGNFSAPITDPEDTGNLTEGRGNNNSDLIIGDYSDSAAAFHGFFFQHGRYRNFDLSSTFTIGLGLNNAGGSCGSFVDDTSGVQEGYTNIGGTVTPVTVAGATQTLTYGINTANAICGYFADNAAITHGYYVDRNGRVRAPIDPPGSTGTIVFGLNDSNWLVGRYPDSSGITHGFILIPPNQFVTFDYPGATFTSFNGINKNGFISGRYTDTLGVDHGFLARAVASTGNGAKEINIKSKQLPAMRPNQAVPKVRVPAS